MAEQDMALGPTSITEEREKAIDFTTPFDFEPWDIMIPAAEEEMDFFTFLMPFSPTVWMGVGMSWIVVSIMLYVISHPAWITVSVYPYTHSDTTPKPLSLLLHLLNSLGSLVSQSGMSWPQTGSLRVLTGWWWMVCVIMIASYSSKLIASITVRFTSPPITSMQQMVQDRPLLWTYQANSAMEELFKYSEPDSMFGKVGGLHREMSGLLVYSFKEGVEAVRNKKFAYIEDASLLEAAVEEDLHQYGSCRMSLVLDHFFSTRFGMILQRGSPYRQAFTMEILHFLDTGLMDAWKRRFWPAASRCVGGAAKRPVRALNIMDMAGILLLFLVGIFLGLLSFCVELLLGLKVLS